MLGDRFKLAAKGEQLMTNQEVSRRTFVKDLGTGVVAASTVSTAAIQIVPTTVHAQEFPQVFGPGLTTVTLQINGVARELSIEPRETLLEVLRNRLDITGPKLVCDRGTCGACTVMIEGQTAYACMTLAIEVQGMEIVTIEGLATGDQLHPAQEAIVEADAIQCGYCSPGFAISMAAILEKNPSASYQEIKQSLSGHICRCGTYAQMNLAIELAREKIGGAL
jgi:aerobic-type carbon monoxide dehydrogenase small subunit (CoxS/CutS family)